MKQSAACYFCRFIDHSAMCITHWAANIKGKCSISSVDKANPWLVILEVRVGESGVSSYFINPYSKFQLCRVLFRYPTLKNISTLLVTQTFLRLLLIKSKNTKNGKCLMNRYYNSLSVIHVHWLVKQAIYHYRKYICESIQCVLSIQRTSIQDINPTNHSYKLVYVFVWHENRIH